MSHIDKQLGTLRWKCECGVMGKAVQPRNTSGFPDGSLAGLVRAARRHHETYKPCLDPDMVSVEIAAEKGGTEK